MPSTSVDPYWIESHLNANNAVLVVILIGGFASNAAWCCWLLTHYRTWTDYGKSGTRKYNVLLAVVSGVIWFGQFFFYGMGSTKLGEAYDFSSWSIHMAFIIIFPICGACYSVNGTA
ncbi:L-rhamnose/proton symporter RhaT [Pirellulales bacterium]|nr:L-rhamnose/proton symporter RhaT [Pirellulales bacterium]